jgi:serine/threonine protein kinase
VRDDQSDSDKTRSVAIVSQGMLVGHYRIVEKIGAGGMGEVYLAEDTELNRKVALKFLATHLLSDPDCITRFKREAQAAAKLDHPNIVTVYEVGEFQGRPFFAMQHIEGRSLREYASHQELSIPQVLEIGIQIAEGLQSAHEKGVTHRDIKPANVLIDSHGRARILDFGLASVAGTDHLTKTGSTLGTIGYMSPEQVRGEQVDHRTDIFSLGVVLYELITGKQPFKGDNDTATSRNIIDTEPEPLARYKSGVGSELQRIISKALQKDKSMRYQHADDLVADMKQLLSPSGPVPVKRSRRMRIVVPLLIVIVLSAIALVFKP